MKTLLITGVYHIETTNLPILYNVTLWGQHPDLPEITYITHLELSLNVGYTELVRICRKEYCKHYGVNDNNLITLDSLKQIDLYSKKLTYKYK